MPRTTPTEPTCEGVVIYAHGRRPAELLAHYRTRLVTIDGQPPEGQPDGGTDDERRLS